MAKMRAPRVRCVVANMILLHRTLYCFLVACSLRAFGDVSCCTWNMEWFPSGKANLRIDKAEEERRTLVAGAQLAFALNDLGEGRLVDRAVVFVQELRDAEACTNLANVISSQMHVAAVSRYVDGARRPLWQQTAILTSLPVVEAGYDEWRGCGDRVCPPRGFAYAVLDGGDDGLIACFCVHLKSNLNRGDSLVVDQTNIYKRERGSDKILAKIAMFCKAERTVEKVIVAGDFNTNEDDESFISESTLRSFYGAHFKSCFTGLKKIDRVTHPANGPYPDATFDYILYRGFGGFSDRKIYSNGGISDHNIVAINLKAEN